MNETPTPDTSESPYPDIEDWEIAFKPYVAYPHTALNLARQLMAVRDLLQSQPPDVPKAKAALDQATDVLFPLTSFHEGAYDLYRTYIEGRATRADEALMESLGIKF